MNWLDWQAKGLSSGLALLMLLATATGFRSGELSKEFGNNWRALQAESSIDSKVSALAAANVRRRSALLIPDTDRQVVPGLPTELVPRLNRRLSVHNLAVLRAGGSAEDAAVNALVALRCLGLRSGNAVARGSEWQELELASTAIRSRKVPVGDLWLDEILSESLARLGGIQLSTNPGRAMHLLIMARAVRAGADPMVSGLLAGAILLFGEDSRDRVPVSQLLEEAAEFPVYLGPRLEEYVQLVVPTLISFGIVERRDLENWSEYLLNTGLPSLSAQLDSRQEPVLSPLEREWRRGYNAGMRSPAARDLWSEERQWVRRQHLKHRRVGSFSLCSCSPERDNTCEAEPHGVNGPGTELAPYEDWSWLTWAGAHNYSRAGFIGSAVQCELRLQGLWWTRQVGTIEPRAGFRSPPIWVGSRSRLCLSLEYRTTGIEGIPNIYIEGSQNIEPTGEMFLARTGGAWVPNRVEIANTSSEESEIRIILRSVGAGTTWFRQVRLCAHRGGA